MQIFMIVLEIDFYKLSFEQDPQLWIEPRSTHKFYLIFIIYPIGYLAPVNNCDFFETRFL